MTTTATAAHRPQRKARAHPQSTPALPPTRLDPLATLLAQRDGASIAVLMSATGWQAHAVRGALAGALKRRGLLLTPEKRGRGYRSRSAR